MRKRGLPEDTWMNNSADAACKVWVPSSIGVNSIMLMMGSFVCATSKKTSETVYLTTYKCLRGNDDLPKSIRIWGACRATSAAFSFSNRLPSDGTGRILWDGGSGANNPVWEVWNQAQAVCGSEPSLASESVGVLTRGGLGPNIKLRSRFHIFAIIR